MGAWQLKGLSFALSFCGFAYQSLMAKTFAVTLGEEIIGFCLSSALFIFGIGLGSRKSAKAPEPLKSLLNVELAIMVLGAAAPIIITYLSFVPALGHIKLMVVPIPPSAFVLVFFLGSGLISTALGGLTGFEIPLLFRLRSDLSDQKGLNQILAFSYFGALAASVLVPLILIPYFEIYGCATLVAFASGGIFLYLWRLEPHQNVKSRFLFSLSFLFVSILAISQSTLQQIALRMSYFEGYPRTISSWSEISQYISDIGYKIKVQRALSPYQAIDVVESMDADNPFFQLYLNKQFQFDSRFEKEYHDAFVQGALTLAPFVPKKILILGAGDGLLLRNILKDLPETTQITMVELDPLILKLAKEDPRWRGLNNDALHSEKVNLITDDAFHFLRESKETWDAVFLDFPYPYSYEVAKLFSLEFYRLVQRHLSAESFIVFDFPIRGSADIIHATLRKVPFNSIIAYEKGETFVFASSLPESSLRRENFSNGFREVPLSPVNEEFVHSLFRPTLPRID